MTEPISRAVAKLTPAGREELTFALVLLKDFKSEGRWNPEVTLHVRKLAEGLGLAADFDAMLPKVPPMLIKERYP